MSSFFKRLLTTLGGPVAFAGALLGCVLASGALYLWQGLPFRDMLLSRAAIAACLVLIAISVLFELRAALSRLWAEVLMAFGVIVLVSGGFIYSAYHFEGTANLGSGEGLSVFKQMSAGPLAEAPEVGLSIENVVHDDAGGWASVRVAEVRGRLEPGKSMRAGAGMQVSLKEVRMAPLLLMYAADGREIWGSFVKIEQGPDARWNYITAGQLPHKLYIRRAPDGTGISLTVTRTKMVVLEDEPLAMGNAVSFEGLTLAYADQEPWGVFMVTYAPGKPAMFIGVLLLVGGAALSVLRKAGRAKQWQR